MATFYKGDVHLLAHLAFNGYNPGPFSLFTSLVGWQEFGLTLDVGAMNWKMFTIGFGGTVYYSQAWFLQATIPGISDYADANAPEGVYNFKWSQWQAGGTFRTTFHLNTFQSVDPYLFAGLGVDNYHLQTRVKSKDPTNPWPDPASREVPGGERWNPHLHNTPALRIEVGAGLQGLLKGRWILGGELRYLISSQFQPVNKLTVQNYDPATDALTGQEATFTLFSQHKPAKGFSWVFHAGIRF